MGENITIDAKMAVTTPALIPRALTRFLHIGLFLLFTQFSTSFSIPPPTLPGPISYSN